MGSWVRVKVGSDARHREVQGIANGDCECIYDVHCVYQAVQRCREAMVIPDGGCWSSWKMEIDVRQTLNAHRVFAGM